MAYAYINTAKVCEDTPVYYFYLFVVVSESEIGM